VCISCAIRRAEPFRCAKGLRPLRAVSNNSGSKTIILSRLIIKAVVDPALLRGGRPLTAPTVSNDAYSVISITPYAPILIVILRRFFMRRRRNSSGRSRFLVWRSRTYRVPLCGTYRMPPQAAYIERRGESYIEHRVSSISLRAVYRASRVSAKPTVLSLSPSAFLSLSQARVPPVRRSRLRRSPPLLPPPLRAPCISP